MSKLMAFLSIAIIMVVFSTTDIVSDNSTSGLVSLQSKIQQPVSVPQGGSIFRLKAAIGIQAKTPVLVDVEYGGWTRWNDITPNTIQWSTQGIIYMLIGGTWQIIDLYVGPRESLYPNTYREYVESEAQAIIGNTYRNIGGAKYYFAGNHTPSYEIPWDEIYDSF